MSNPHSDISIDDYQPDDFVGNAPSEYDRTTEHRRHQPAPADLRDRDVLPTGVLPTDAPIASAPASAPPTSGPGQDRVQRSGNRAERRAAEQQHARETRREHSSLSSGPVEREANGVTVTSVDYDGETYWVPVAPEDWDARATRAFEDGKGMTALQYILEPGEDGRPGYDLLLSKHYRMRQINELFDLVAEIGGFETAGN